MVPPHPGILLEREYPRLRRERKRKLRRQRKSRCTHGGMRKIFFASCASCAHRKKTDRTLSDDPVDFQYEPRGIRTRDTWIKSPVLYHLS